MRIGQGSRLSVIASRVIAKTWQSGLLFCVLLLASSANAFMVAPLSAEYQLENSCYAGYFEVISNQKITDPNGFPSIVYKLKCLDPIKGCNTNEEIEIKVANVSTFRSAQIVVDMPVGNRFVGFYACPSKLGFSNFFGMPQNSYYPEIENGRLKVPELELGRNIQNIQSDKLLNTEINKKNIESQSSIQTKRENLTIDSKGTTDTQQLLERYRQIKRIKEGQ